MSELVRFESRRVGRIEEGGKIAAIDYMDTIYMRYIGHCLCDCDFQ